MPPGLPACGFGRVCFFATFKLSTITFPSGSTRVTLPRRPLSLPAITITSSPCLMRCIPKLSLQDFGSERDDLHELRRAQLARHGSEDAGADRLELVGQKHRRVAVETNQRAVRPAQPVPRAHDDR